MRGAFALVTSTSARDPAYRPAHPPTRAYEAQRRALACIHRGAVVESDKVTRHHMAAISIRMILIVAEPGNVTSKPGEEVANSVPSRRVASCLRGGGSCRWSHCR